jgi:hypothetical protein
VNYKNQFRAVFTVNTIDDTSQVLEVEGEVCLILLHRPRVICRNRHRCSTG